jgi:uncharacterized protein (DUF1015 family)
VASLFPFRALRPVPEAAARVASVPYDVVNAAEAQALAAGNSLSFLHVTRAEIDLHPQTNPYADEVYAQAVRNLEALKRAAPLVIEPAAALYVYRLRIGSHEQTGIAGCFSLDEYDRDVIKKHERTRKDKEDDRTRHIVELRAQTGLVFLTYVAMTNVDRLVARTTAGLPLYDFTAADGVAHTVWQVDAERLPEFVEAFARIPTLYIADGHHRAASAARARDVLDPGGRRGSEASRFVAVAFPDTQVQILPYHRVVADLNGRTADAFLDRLRARMPVADGAPAETRKRLVGMFIAGRWHALTLPEPAADASRADALDVAILEREVLRPELGIEDLRTDKRVDFIGGARGTAELEKRVASGSAAVAFALHPVGIDDLMAISDAGGIMPPKSTWFEPKLRDGLLVHLI